MTEYDPHESALEHYQGILKTRDALQRTMFDRSGDSVLVCALAAKGFKYQVDDSNDEWGDVYSRQLTSSESNAYWKEDLPPPDDNTAHLYLFIRENGEWDASWEDNGTDAEGNDAISLLKFLNSLPF